MYKDSRDLYEFGGFRLDATERLLLREGVVVPLTPKAFDVLLALVEQPGRLLEKEVLLRRVWPDSFVEENNLADNISRLRKVLRDGENGHKFIETVPKRGYRFVAAVKELSGESTAAPLTLTALVSAEPEAPTLPVNPASSFRLRQHLPLLLGLFGLLVLTIIGVVLYLRAKPVAAVESLAVLPFSADSQIEYLSDGITESLINNLSRLSNLRVTARTTAFSYKGKEVNPRQVGQELGVSTVLTGRVALRDDALTVQVDLVDAATGTQVWGERYQRKLADIFAVKEEVGKQIAEKLRLRLSGEEQRQLSKRYTDNAEVYQLYLLGLYLYDKKTEGGIHKAIGYFEQAIAKDPNYAPAYPGLAYCYVTLSTEEEPKKLLPKAKAAALKALEIDNDLAEAHATLGWIKWVYELDRVGAESELEQALKLNPNSADARYRYARLLADTGRFDEAEIQAKKAIDIDPLSIQYKKGTPYILYLSRRYTEAIAEYRKLIDVAPDFIQTQRELGLAYEQIGRYDEAFSQLQKAFAMPGNRGRTMVRADLGHLYAVWGKRAEAEQVLAELIKQSEQSYVSAYDIAVIYAGLGETEKAFAWLDKAVEQRSFWLCWLKLDPRLDKLRPDPRFDNLLRRLAQIP
jgi:TolB-like protein/DNA-binding winged helix-turn-helix (wHTH) protein/Tfp pilus assembly protein PilF